MSSLLKGHCFVHDRDELFVAVADFDQGEVHAGKIFDSIRGALKDLGSEDARAGGKIVFFHGRMVPIGGKVQALQRYQMPLGAPNDFAPFFMGFQQVEGSTCPGQNRRRSTARVGPVGPEVSCRTSVPHGRDFIDENFVS